MSAIATIPSQRSLVMKFAERFGVDADKLLHTLKATCFKTKEPATNEQMMALLVVADQYRLNPFTKEIFAFEDKHKGIIPVVSVDGWARIINAHPAYNGCEFRYSDKLVTMAGGKPCPEWCEVVMFRKDRDNAIVVREYLDEVYQPPRSGYSGPWQSHTKRFLRHKTFIQGARIAFGFAGIYDEDEAHRIIQGEATRLHTVARHDVATLEARLIERGASSGPTIERGASSEPAEATTATDWHEAAQSLNDALTNAADRATLDDKASMIGTLPEDLRAPLYALYDQRCTELENN